MDGWMDRERDQRLPSLELSIYQADKERGKEKNDRFLSPILESGWFGHSSLEIRCGITIAVRLPNNRFTS